MRGNIARRQRKRDEAQKHFKLALANAKEKTNGALLRAIYYKLGVVARDLGNIEEVK